MTKLRALAVLLVLAALVSLPCRKQVSVRGIELSVTFSNRVLSDNLFTEATFRFRTTPLFAPIAEDNDIVSEFARRGKILLEDRFEPPVPTSKWEPDKEYTFTRRIYIPPFIDEFAPEFRGAETLDLSVGLASPPGGGRSRLVVYLRKLRVVPVSESPVIVSLDGWYGFEADPADPAKTWRWTSREARAAIDNPGRDALLVLRGFADPAAPAGQKITISVDGRVLDEFVPGPGEFERRSTVPKDWLGSRKDFVLTIGVDRTFVPAKVVAGSGDNRELGVRISLVYFR
jgi:hypothetical protein